MAMRFSTKSQPFVTNLDSQDLGQRERDLRDIEVLYLHVNKGENGEGNIQTIGNILVGLQKVEHPIKEFSNIEECFSYIHERPDAKIYLILLNGLDENRMSTLKKYSHVLSIYQFDSPFPWIKEEDATTDSDSLNVLFGQLNSRHRLIHSNDASGNSVDFLPENNSIDSRLFIKYQLLMEILLRLPVTEESRKDFIDWSLENYSTNPGDKKKIDLFAKQFTPDKAIKWYTKESFVNRILGRTFASNDFRLIYKTRYFIRPLYVELKSLHEETFALLDSKIVVYRGKTMSISAFDELKASVKKLVITKCFVSASLNKLVAEVFSGGREVKAGNVAVIFRMKIDKFENKSKAFAYIGHKSTKPDENEFLLGPGIIFLNKNITMVEENMFIVELIHRSEEEEIEEEIIRSNTNHLEGAQNIESPDEFDLFITTTSSPLNEQVTPQPSGVQDDEQNNRPIEPQPSGSQTDEQNNRPTEPQLIPMIQQQTTQQMTENLPQVNREVTRATLAAWKLLWNDITRLRMSNICNGTSAIFSIDQTPFNDDDEGIFLRRSNVIIGRIFPLSNIYNQRGYKIEIRFPPSYPFDPPEVHILTPVYHPNITREGILCSKILQRSGSWTPLTPLTSVITAVVDAIDNPDMDSAVNLDAAQEYMENRAVFDRKALDMVREHGLPRQ